MTQMSILLGALLAQGAGDKASVGEILFWALVAIVAVVVVVILAMFLTFGKLWLQAYSSGCKIPFKDFIIFAEICALIITAANGLFDFRGRTGNPAAGLA